MKNITWHESNLTRKDRLKLVNTENKVLWFTGLSASGKSTIANEVEKELYKREKLSYVLDGDNIRHGLNSDLGFSQEDREENIRRIAQVTKLFYQAGLYVIVCFISPYEKEREYARSLIGKDFIEIFVDCPIEECEKRDPKGLYKKAREGIIKDFTGISAPYEKPKKPELIIDSSEPVGVCVKKILNSIISSAP
jgi:adenylylsulfate kinase